MKLYGAIDLHSNNNVTVLMDEQDQVVYQKRLANESGINYPAALGLSGSVSRHCRRVDLQLVLVGRWPAYAVSWWMVWLVIGVIMTPIFWIWGMVDAYRVARRIYRDVGMIAPFEDAKLTIFLVKLG